MIIERSCFCGHSLSLSWPLHASPACILCLLAAAIIDIASSKSMGVVNNQYEAMCFLAPLQQLNGDQVMSVRNGEYVLCAKLVLLVSEEKGEGRDGHS